jgi:hypothetical protein
MNNNPLIILKGSITMSKNTKRTTISGNAGIDALTINPNVRDIPAIDATIDDTIAELKAQTEPVKAQAKAKASKKAKADTTPKAPAIKYDLPTILAALPDPITPAILDKAFGLNDGGKTVRRHLRNHFAEKMAHNKKDKWAFDKADSTDIIEYFASRYAFHADAINTAKEEVKA